MTQGKDIIYVNGDSFTAGVDLADYLLGEGVQEFSLKVLLKEHDEKKVLDYSLWRAKKRDGASPEFLSKMIEIEKENRWSEKLKELTGIEVVNNSLAGSDNFGIFTRSCLDIEKLKQEGYNIVAAIIQITGFERSSYVRKLSGTEEDEFYVGGTNKELLFFDEYYYLRSLIPMYLGTEKITELENQFLRSQLTSCSVYDDQEISAGLINELLRLKIYKEAIRGIIGFDPIIVDSMFMRVLLIRESLEKEVNLKGSLANRLFTSVFTENILSMMDIPAYDEKSLTGGYHFLSWVHEKFAGLIAERYFQ